MSKVCFVMADLIRHLILSSDYQCRMRSRGKPGMTGQCILTQFPLCVSLYRKLLLQQIQRYADIFRLFQNLGQVGKQFLYNRQQYRLNLIGNNLRQFR